MSRRVMIVLALALTATRPLSDASAARSPRSHRGAPAGVEAAARPEFRPLDTPPRLVVVVSVDQMRADQLLAPAEPYRAGFARLLADGAVYTHCYYRQAITKTGPGHAVISTGAYPHRSGIVANNWYVPSRGKDTYCVEDSSVRLLGAPDTTGRDCQSAFARPASPRNLLAEALGDRLVRHSHGRSRVVAVSGKDDSAVLMAGRDGRAYWMDDCSGLLVTSTYYHADLASVPDWVKRFNASLPMDRYFGATWAPLAGEGPLQDSVPAKNGSSGMGPQFPHRLGGANGRRDGSFARAVAKSPLAADWAVRAAEAAMLGERLGKGPSTDLLWVGLSEHDLIGHDFGPESAEMRDALRREDRALGHLMRSLDQWMDPGNYVLALISDHGVAVMPEDTAAWARESERMDPRGLPARPCMWSDPLEVLRSRAPDSRGARADSAAMAAFPASGRLRIQRVSAAMDSLTALLRPTRPRGRWRMTDPYANFRPDPAGALDPLTSAEVSSVAARLPVSVPLQAAMPARELAALRGGCDFEDALRLSYREDRSGTVYLVPREGWVFASTELGTQHGTPHAYDQHVPLVFFGLGFPAGRHGERVSPADLAPTLGALLGIGPPAQAEGTELFRVSGKRNAGKGSSQSVKGSGGAKR